MSADSHDQWHHHTTDEGAPQHEHIAKVNPKALGLTFIGMTLGVLLVIIVLVVYFQNYMSTYKSQINENTTAAETTWHDKQDILGQIDPRVASASQSVIDDYASPDQTN